MLLRLQAEVVALCKVISADHTIGVKWLRESWGAQNAGRAFYNSHKKALGAALEDLGLGQIYSIASEMAGHPRLGGVAGGISFSTSGQDSAISINLSFTDSDKVADYLFMLWNMLALQLTVIQGVAQIYGRQSADDIIVLKGLLDEVQRVLMPMLPPEITGGSGGPDATADPDSATPLVSA